MWASTRWAGRPAGFVCVAPAASLQLSVASSCPSLEAGVAITSPIVVSFSGGPDGALNCSASGSSVAAVGSKMIAAPSAAPNTCALSGAPDSGGSLFVTATDADGGVAVLGGAAGCTVFSRACAGTSAASPPHAAITHLRIYPALVFQRSPCPNPDGLYSGGRFDYFGHPSFVTSGSSAATTTCMVSGPAATQLTVQSSGGACFISGMLGTGAFNVTYTDGANGVAVATCYSATGASRSLCAASADGCPARRPFRSADRRGGMPSPGGWHAHPLRHDHSIRRINARRDKQGDLPSAGVVQWRRRRGYAGPNRL